MNCIAAIELRCVTHLYVPFIIQQLFNLATAMYYPLISHHSISYEAIL